MEIIKLNGVGPKTSKLLENINIFTTDDLLEYYPYKYNFIKFLNLEDLTSMPGYIECVVKTTPIIYYIKKNFNKLQFKAEFNKQIFNVVIFNRAFLKPNIKINNTIIVIGKYDSLKN